MTLKGVKSMLANQLTSKHLPVSSLGPPPSPYTIPPPPPGRDVYSSLCQPHSGQQVQPGFLYKPDNSGQHIRKSITNTEHQQQQQHHLHQSFQTFHNFPQSPAGNFTNSQSLTLTYPICCNLPFSLTGKLRKCLS